VDYLKELIFNYNKLIYNSGLNSLRDGNISLHHDNKLYITPKKSDGGPLTNRSIEAKDILCWPMGGQPEGNPSSEWRKHFALFNQYSQVKAIIHCHAPHAIALATKLAKDKNEQQYQHYFLEYSEYQHYDAPPILREDIIPLNESKPYDTVVCPFHGVSSVGKDLATAFEKLERLEYYSKIILLTL